MSTIVRPRQPVFPTLAFKKNESHLRMEHDLDLLGVACPMNFVKCRLFLDKLSPGDLLHVLIDAGEPVESVCQSLTQEGNEILARNEQSGGHFRVSIRKV